MNYFVTRIIAYVVATAVNQDRSCPLFMFKLECVLVVLAFTVPALIMPVKSAPVTARKSSMKARMKAMKVMKATMKAMKVMKSTMKAMKVMKAPMKARTVMKTMKAMKGMKGMKAVKAMKAMKAVNTHKVGTKKVGKGWPKKLYATTIPGDKPQLVDGKGLTFEQFEELLHEEWVDYRDDTKSYKTRSEKDNKFFDSLV